MSRNALMWSMAMALAVAGSAQAIEAPKSSAAEEQARADAIKAALARAAGAKMAVEAFHLAQKKFPASNAEVNLGSPDTYAGGALKRLEIVGDGEVQLVLGPSSGVDDGIIRLRPQPSPRSDENTLEWTCVTPSYAGITDITGGLCSYKK